MNAEYLYRHALQTIVVLLACYRWRYLDTFARLICTQVILSASNDLIARVSVDVLQWTLTTTVQYNFYILAEGLLLLAATRPYIKATRMGMRLYISGLLYTVVWLYIIIRRPDEFAAYAYILEMALLLGWYLLVLYQSVLQDGPSITNPALWLCIGMIMYTGCSIPYISFMHYLGTYHKIINTKLFTIIHASENIRYIFTGIALYLYRAHAHCHNNLTHVR